MKNFFVVVLFSVFLFAANAVTAQTPSNFPCLDTSIELADIVSFARDSNSKNVTVADRLVQLRAKCRRGRLLDRQNREIRFFKNECWGNPPANYQEILREKRREVVKLKRKYTVIEIACDLRQTV